MLQDEVALSVVIPAFNVAAVITSTLDSLATLKAAVEVLVVDDGSTDQTSAKVGEIIGSGQYPHRLTLIRQANGGVSAARNAGLLAAKGEYVLFLDGDDRVSARLSGALGTAAGHGRPDAFCWAWDRTLPRGQTVFAYRERHSMCDRSMVGPEALLAVLKDRDLSIWTGSIAYRIEFLRANRLQFTSGCVCGEDGEFLYRALSRAETVVFIGEVLSFYTQRPGSMTERYDPRRLDAIGALLRASSDLAEVNDDRVREASRILAQSAPVACFATTLASLLVAPPRGGIRRVVSDMDSAYPGLTRDIRDRASRLQADGAAGAVPMEYRMYAVSPLVLAFYARARRRESRVKRAFRTRFPAGSLWSSCGG